MTHHLQSMMSNIDLVPWRSRAETRFWILYFSTTLIAANFLIGNAVRPVIANLHALMSLDFSSLSTHDAVAIAGLLLIVVMLVTACVAEVCFVRHVVWVLRTREPYIDDRRHASRGFLC